MVLILLSWLYIFFTSLTLGIGFSKLFQIKSHNLVITPILGLFGVTLLASFWAILGPISIAFHLFLLGSTIALGYHFKSNLIGIVKNGFEQFSSFSLWLKVLLGMNSLLILAQSAALPFVVDNETYYLQTIKWLNEYGLVPGLANLHLFLGQTSGWHLTQSVYSFSFSEVNLNDLNGFLLLLCNGWALAKLHSYFSLGNRLDLAFGLLPLTYIFLFQFVSAPSPDLPVYILGFIVFSMYSEQVKEPGSENFSLLTVLVLFAVYIKITAVALLILPLLLLIKHFGSVKKQLLSIRLLGGLVLFLFITKNIILTGYPLYPLSVLPYPDVDYLVPKEVMTYFFGGEMMHSFYMGFGNYQTASLSYFFKQYFLHNGINSIIATMTIFVLLVTPFILSKYYPKQKLGDLYFVFIVLLVILAFSSPQYRFYVYFTIFFGLIILAVLLTKKEVILGLLIVSSLIIGFLVFVPMSFGSLTRNKLLAESSTIQLENLIFPKPITKENLNFVKDSRGNLEYYSPSNATLFWMTGNGNLPCVNREQLDYFETNFQIIPQLRGKTLGEGFYPQKKKSND